MKQITKISAIVSLFSLALAVNAAVIDFTGGTVTRYAGGPNVTANNANYDNADFYVENGFKLDFIGNNGAGDAFAANVGDYYGVRNDVIHGHWATGSFGDLITIRITKVAGGTFDLNYFILTSNTQVGGGFATGLENAFISHDGGLNPIRLPSQDWGFGLGGPFPGTSQIFLPASYDAVTFVDFTVGNKVDCFGMDEFYIDEPAPPAVPDAGSALTLLGLSFAGLAGLRARMRS